MNLFDPFGSGDYAYSDNGVVSHFSTQSGILTLNGTPSGSPELFKIYMTLDAGTYTVKSEYLSGSISGSGCLAVDAKTSDANSLSSRRNLDIYAQNCSNTWTFDNSLASSVGTIVFWIWNNGSISFNDLHIKFSIVRSDGTECKLTSADRNYSGNGVTAHYNPQTNILTLNGTASCECTLFYIPAKFRAGTYTVKTEVMGGSSSGAAVL